ncbi:putative integral membrane protein [Paratrimastix pyriformis]|uniref:Integral membrane protein n=1 Tax=Paratrimastix pyriformis TaxID=342808 RepID=A0ABQ8UJP0_9EUKA|nr:putative integral membrane protein [Paratrimastix pyriformis]
MQITTPISKRALDFFFIVGFSMFFVIAWLIDYINAIAPVGGFTPDTAALLSWPPKWMVKGYFWWCESCDPLLLANPMWFKFLSALSPFVFSPFYLVAIYAIYTGKNWIRMPIVVYASMLFLDLLTIFVDEFYGPTPSPNPLLFAMGYGPYLLFPLALLARFWNEAPFSPRPKSRSA